jgi:hypothetical protein
VNGAADRYWGGAQSCSEHITHVDGERGPSKLPLHTNSGEITVPNNQMYSMVPTATMVGPELPVRVDGAADRYWGGAHSCSEHITHVDGE